MAEATEMTDVSNETGAESAQAGDLNLDLQDRMAEGVDDAWYSSSNGLMFDGKGNELVHPETKKPFTSQAEYDAFVAQSKATQTAQAKNPAEQQQNQAAQPKPMSRSFDSIVAGPDGQINAAKLFELSKRNEAYKYNNELIPVVDATLQQTRQTEAQKSPIQEAQEYRQTRIDGLSKPLIALRDAVYQELVNQGANKDAAVSLVSKIADSVYKQHVAEIESDYKQREISALEKMAELKAKAVTDPVEKDRLTAKSMSNIERLAKVYYPDNGSDAFFSLVNGHQADTGFVRGPATQVIDLLMQVASRGQKFANEGERTDFYGNEFQKLTADPVTAQALFDIVHNYWLGKNVQAAYQSGKSKGIQEAQAAKKLVKPRPTANQSGVASEEDDGNLPTALKAFLKR